MFQPHDSELRVIVLTYSETHKLAFSLEVRTSESVKEVKSLHILFLPPARPLNTSSSLGCFVCSRQQSLPRSAAGRPRDRGIVLCVNTVCPTEVKIVPSSILSQQSQ